MTRQQKWAKEAYAKVTAYRGKADEKKYRTLCMKMPVLILQSGLVQAIAFVRSREKKKNVGIGEAFCNDLAAVYGITDADGGKALMEQVQGADDLSVYLAMTRDLIDVSTWFQRFAQSELESEES